MRADLHTHSTASDGTRSPAEMMRRAAAAGLDAVALTDHDTVAGIEEAARALPCGLTLVPGMELSCRRDGHSVHMLAYLFDPGHPELAAECLTIRQSRVSRAREMVAKLADLGTGVTWDQVSAIAGGGVVGRPHIARAMLRAGVISSFDEAFTAEWLAPGGRAHAGRYALDPVNAIALVRAAGGVCVLAHPFVQTRGWLVPDALIEELASAGLAGVEVSHPSHEQDERLALADLAARLDLVSTGGSDDHGELTADRIGVECTSGEAFERLVSAAHGAPVIRGSQPRAG
ncbi:MAG TPA: PHP domain-containing protein [Streptosporangiaceae bacterium]|nr:PHP domain-containing protein [Streptosporangiaceae bacterium]